LIVNLINVSFYENLSYQLAQQDKIIYLQENQSWEMPLIHFLKYEGQSSLIGFPHASIRFWDLRYFFSYESFNDIKLNSKPRPHFVAVNGPVLKNLLISSRYPKNELINVESLRYFHLLKNSTIQKTKFIKKTSPTILILGDYLQANNFRLLSLLDKASYYLPFNTVYLYKPHPSLIKLNYKLKNIKLNISNVQLKTLLDQSNIVYSSNQTSASLDAYYTGTPVIISLFSEILNLSPLRNFSNVDFIDYEPKLLAKKILLNYNKIYHVDYEDYFFLNKDLKYWNKLI